MSARQITATFTVPQYTASVGVALIALDSYLSSGCTPESLRERFQAILPDLRVEYGPELLVGHVLRYETRTERVMSDVWEDRTYAVIWTGEAERETDFSGYTGSTWDGSKQVHHFLPGFERSDGQSHNQTWCSDAEVGTTRTFIGYHWTVDATEEVRQARDAWVAECDRVAGIRYRAKSFAKYVAAQIAAEKAVRTGCDVRVVKGRKVKVGTEARVQWAGDGQYGPYANLRTAAGVEYKFVSTGNLEVISDWSYVFRGAIEAYGMSSTVVALLRAYGAGQCEWGIVCDAVQDMDYEFGEHLRQTDPANM